jgi:hypothetical protein
MSASHAHAPESSASSSDPKLRHEFVGMMFAVTIGEVGLQLAPVVQAGPMSAWYPAYGHLFLAVIVIATSWVGWTLSVAPGARQDVKGIFQWEFLVLLLDVTLVILYFLLVRALPFPGEHAKEIPPFSRTTSLLAIIFFLYLLWDFLAEIILWNKYGKPGGEWLPRGGLRMAMTAVCLLFVLMSKRLIDDAGDSHRLRAELALVFLVLLFRALKEFSEALEPPAEGGKRQPERAIRPGFWSFVCFAGMFSAIVWTRA